MICGQFLFSLIQSDKRDASRNRSCVAKDSYLVVSDGGGDQVVVEWRRLGKNLSRQAARQTDAG